MDASDCGMGAVLSRMDEDGCNHPVAYYSMKFLPREEGYAAVEKECLAVKLGIHTFRVHLLGRKFVVVTDHRSLEWLQRMKGNNSRLTRWSLNLQPYHFEVQYRPGKTNSNADGLLRMWGPRFNDDVIAGKGGGGVKYCNPSLMTWVIQNDQRLDGELVKKKKHY